MIVRTFMLTQQSDASIHSSIEDPSSMETLETWLKLQKSNSENLDSTLHLALIDARRGYQNENSNRRNEIREMLEILGPIPSEACISEDLIQFNHHPHQVRGVELLGSPSSSALYSIADLTFGVAWSFCPKSFRTIGIVWFFDDEGASQTNELLDSLVTHQACIIHPMLLGLLVHQIMGRSLKGWIRMHAQRVMGVQNNSGYHDFAVKRRADYNANVASLSATVGRVSISISTCVLNLQGLVELGMFILEENELFLKKTLNASANISTTKEHEKDLHNLCNYILQHVKTSLRNSQALLREAEDWARKSTIIVQGLLSLTTQRDAEVSIRIAEDSKALAKEVKRDSTSMKAIAAVTMCFLPGTFVAVRKILILLKIHLILNIYSQQSFFAMPIFVWDATADGLVTRHFWIYWAVTAPLTAVVLIIWLAWTLFSERDWKLGSIGKKKKIG